jgi:hypothetical protein
VSPSARMKALEKMSRLVSVCKAFISSSDVNNLIMYISIWMLYNVALTNTGPIDVCTDVT